MDVKRCDRCGQFYVEPKTIGISVVLNARERQINYIGNTYSHCDLCQDCWDRFRKWLGRE